MPSVKGGLTRLVLLGLPQGADLKAVLSRCTRSADIVNVYTSILK